MHGTMTKTLRPHQVRAIEMLRNSIRGKKRRPVLKLPTGAGKTLIATKIIANARERGNRVLFIVDAIELIDQTVNAFYGEGLSGIGVIQANHQMTDYSRPIQIASVQTLARRKPPEFDMAIVDECHAQYAAIRELMDQNPGKIFIGLSATPWSKGLGLLYDDLIEPATIRDLTELGYVAKLQAYAPSHPDLTGVKVRAGEYQEEQLSKVMRGEKLVADIVETWKRLGDNRPTFCFCVDRAHAAAMQERFQREWIGCGYIDGMTEARERKAIKAQLDAGEIQIVVSVGTMIKGVDWKIGTIIDAQPTKSPMRHVQKLGRLRPFPEWEYALVLDHSDNILRLGLPIDIHRDTLCTKKKGEKGDAEAMMTKQPTGCPACGQVRSDRSKACPCGFVPKVQGADIEEGAGSLALVNGDKAGPKKQKATPAEKAQFFAEMLGYAKEKGKKDSYALAVFRERYQEWPHKKNGVQPVEPSIETRMYIQAKNIRWSKGKGRSDAKR
jgi:superfamily II DNA or RNA helicase